MWGQEAERFAFGLFVLTIFLGASGRRSIVDVTSEEDRRALLADQPHWVILLATLAAEVNGIEALVRTPRQEVLPFHGHLPLTGRLDGRVGVAGAGDELVKLEGEEALLAGLRI
jgi:hypothetical protein